MRQFVVMLFFGINAEKFYYNYREEKKMFEVT